jgi:Fn3 associated
MIRAIDVIDLLPGELAARLQCDPFFADIPVIVVESGNVATELARKQAVITEKSGKRGVAVIVLQCLADDKDANVNFGPMILRPAFQVVEQVELNNDPNGTGKSARMVARKIIDVIKPLRLVGLTTDFVCDKPAIEPGTSKDDLGRNLISYIVNFATYECDAEPVSLCSMPVFSLSPGDVSPLILTAGPLETIWYTTDDSFPAPTDRVPGSTAQVYSTPLEIPAAGFTIRTAAYRAGCIASPVNRAEINATTITTQQ